MQEYGKLGQTASSGSAWKVGSAGEIIPTGETFEGKWSQVKSWQIGVLYCFAQQNCQIALS